MNYRTILKVIGGLLLLLSLGQFACLLYAWLGDLKPNAADAVPALATSLLASGLTGLAFMFMGRGGTDELLRKESIAVVGVGWLVCVAFGSLPYALFEPGLGVVDALFESMSGFTTTGASVIGNLEEIPNGIILWRSLTQWFGGMGILVLFVALLSSFRAGSRAIFRHETSAQDTGGIATRSSEIALSLWKIYVGLSVVCFLGLRLLGMSTFDAVCHAFTTVATAGFSTHSESIAYFQSVWIELWVILFMIAGGINFMLYAWILRGKWERWHQDEETKVFLGFLAAAAIVIGLDLAVIAGDASWASSFRAAAFQTVSIMTTTGFSSDDFNQWPPLSHVLLLLLMLVGGCAGSTSGGVKLSRWILFMKSIKLQLTAAFRPNRVMRLTLNGRTVSDTLRLDTLFLIALTGVTVFLGTAAVSFFEPRLDMASSASAVFATVLNIGPGLGDVGPTQTYGHLAPYTKLLLTFFMALGRLEFYTIMALLMPSLWKNY